MTKLVFSWEPSAELVSTSTPPARRKTEAQLRRMQHVDRLLYYISHPVSEREREARFEREMKGLDEMTWADQQEPPEDGEDHFR